MHTMRRGHRMCSGPLRLFASCRSMGIECGQGGLRIDRGPLLRCAYWDVEAREGVKMHLGPLDVVFLPLTV